VAAVRLTLAGRAWLLGVATLGMAVLIWLAVYSDHIAAAFVTPVAFGIYVMLVVHNGYFVLRELKWRRRQRVERDAADELAIPPDVPEPNTFEGVKEIDDAQHQLLPAIPDYQGAYLARGIRIALLPAIAVVFVAVQASFANSTALAAGLIAGDVILLLSIMWLVWADPDPVKDWLVARVRTELLRREQYLRLACVGPYLGLTADVAGRRVRSRIIAIRNADFGQLRQLLSMTGEPYWADEIWRNRSATLPARNLADRMRSYLCYRIDKQIMWFTLGTKANERAESRLARTVKAVLVIATVGAVTQVALIWQRPIPIVAALIGFASLVMPAACVLLLGVQQLLSYQRLAMSYADTRRELFILRAVLSDLLDRLETAGSDATGEFGWRFQSVVLRLENELTQELLRWIMFIRRSEFDASL
jgi:hypothetical protein